MAKEAIIRIKGDSSHYENVLRRTKKTSQDSFQSIMGYAKAYLSIQAAKELLLFSGKVDTVSRTFKALATSYGKSSNELLQAVKKASRGTISELSIMESANSAMQLMGQDVIKMLPEMAEIATKTARAQGVSAEQMLSDIVTASGRQSTMILDNLGISSVQAGQYMEEYAAKLGKTRQQLTDSERSAAFFYATLKAGGEIAARSGDDTLTLGERVQKLKADFSDFTTWAAEGLMPILNKIGAGFSYVADKMREIQKERARGTQTTERFQDKGKAGYIERTKFDGDKEWQYKQVDAAGNVVKMWTEAAEKVTQAKAKISSSPNQINTSKNTEAEKYKEAHATMSEYYERLGQYQNAAIQREFESYQSFLKTQEGKTALAYNQAALEEEFANRKLLADVAGAQNEVAIKEQVIRAKLGLESAGFQGAMMFANAGAQLMSSQNKKLFKIGQVAAVATAWMNIAQAITKGYTYGPVIGSAYAALMGVVGGVQTKNIMSQKPPGEVKPEKSNLTSPTLSAPVITPPKFAAGVFDIPNDTFAQLHAGETVVPKNFTESIKDGELSLGGGGVTVNIYGDSYGYDDLMGKITSGLKDIEKRSGKQVFSSRVID